MLPSGTSSYPSHLIICSSTPWPLCQNVEALHHTASTFILLFQKAHPPRKVLANFTENPHNMLLFKVPKNMVQVGSFPVFHTQCLQKSTEKYFLLWNVHLAAPQNENSLCCYYYYMQIKSHLWRENQTGHTAIVATVYQYVHTWGPNSSGMQHWLVASSNQHCVELVHIMGQVWNHLYTLCIIIQCMFLYLLQVMMMENITMQNLSHFC